MARGLIGVAKQHREQPGRCLPSVIRSAGPVVLIIFVSLLGGAAAACDPSQVGKSGEEMTAGQCPEGYVPVEDCNCAMITGYVEGDECPDGYVKTSDGKACQQTLGFMLVPISLEGQIGLGFAVLIVSCAVGKFCRDILPRLCRGIPPNSSAVDHSGQNAPVNLTTHVHGRGNASRDATAALGNRNQPPQYATDVYWYTTQRMPPQFLASPGGYQQGGFPISIVCKG